MTQNARCKKPGIRAPDREARLLDRFELLGLRNRRVKRNLVVLVAVRRGLLAQATLFAQMKAGATRNKNWVVGRLRGLDREWWVGAQCLLEYFT